MFERAFVLGLMCACAGAQAVGLSDPTAPSRPAPVIEAARLEGPRWQLQSTLTAAHRRLAVINGRIVAAGDRVDGARVLRVEPGMVALETEHGARELRLAGVPSVKTPVR